MREREIELLNQLFNNLETKMIADEKRKSYLGDAKRTNKI